MITLASKYDLRILAYLAGHEGDRIHTTYFEMLGSVTIADLGRGTGA